MSGFAVYPQIVFHGPPKSTNFPNDRRQIFLQTSRKLYLSSKESIFLQSVRKAASASSSPPLDGSGAQHHEQLSEEKLKKKRREIAGIDQDELLDPPLLADSDSCFCEFKGVQIHHKVCDAKLPAQNLLQDGVSSQVPSHTKKLGLPMILLHGFGASVFSWDRVLKPLAQVTGSKVLAFDRPAFGLTSRVNSFKHSSPDGEDKKPLNPYSMIFSVLATLYFINFLGAEKAILVGHSAGSLVAVETYFEAPERIAALILVGPAVLAPFFSQKHVTENQNGRDNQTPEDQSNSNINQNPVINLWSILSKVPKYIFQVIMRATKGMVEMLNSLYKKALSSLLRSAIGVMLVRMVIDKFGITAIRNSWYNPNQVNDHILRGYTKPLRVKDWDKALVEYTVAMFTDPVSESKPPLTKRLNNISCPVLVVTGDNDRLVPAWNSERLSKAIPEAYFEVIRNCGHLPQEERSEEFVSVVEKFLQRVFGNSEVQFAQAAT